MIMSFLPEFKVFEMNNLTGLRNGHILANMKADSGIKTVSYGTHKFVENGLILGLNADGTVGNYSTANHKQPFVHFTEELLTFVNELKYYAEPVVDGVVYPRCVALYVGDTFTTNNYDNTANVEGDGYAAVTNGVLTLQAGAEGAMFKATASTLPDGSAAYEFLYLGV